MGIRIVLPALAVLPLIASCAMDSDGPSRAGVRSTPTVVLIGPDGRSRGTVTPIQTDGGLIVHVEGTGLPPGVHGTHIHEVGRCDAPDFATAGPHWNPTGRQHGIENMAGPHLGDTPNLVIDSSGRGEIEFNLPDVWLRRSSTPILDGDGAAFVIHADRDDLRTDPSGNSGGRIACAVLR